MKICRQILMFFFNFLQLCPYVRVNVNYSWSYYRSVRLGVHTGIHGIVDRYMTCMYKGIYYNTCTAIMVNRCTYYYVRITCTYICIYIYIILCIKYRRRRVRTCTLWPIASSSDSVRTATGRTTGKERRVEKKITQRYFLKEEKLKIRVCGWRGRSVGLGGKRRRWSPSKPRRRRSRIITQKQPVCRRRRRGILCANPILYRRRLRRARPRGCRPAAAAVIGKNSSRGWNSYASFVLTYLRYVDGVIVGKRSATISRVASVAQKRKYFQK